MWRLEEGFGYLWDCFGSSFPEKSYSRSPPFPIVCPSSLGLYVPTLIPFFLLQTPVFLFFEQKGFIPSWILICSWSPRYKCGAWLGRRVHHWILNSLTAFIYLFFSGSSAGLCHVTIPKLRAPYGHLCPLSHNLKTAWWPFCNGSLQEALISVKKSFPGIPMPLSPPYSSVTLNKQRQSHTWCNKYTK